MKQVDIATPGSIELSGMPKKPPHDYVKSRFAINVGTNVAYIAVNTLLMVWYIPFLIKHLGMAAYGMIPLANLLVMYSSVISAGLEVSTNRYLAIDLNQGEQENASRTFNTALFLSLVACCFISIPAAIVTYLYPVLFSVPTGMEQETRFLFGSAVFTVLISIIGGNFGVSSIIKHRFDLYNIVRTVVSLSRVGIVAFAFLLWLPSLWWVATGFIVSACINLAGNVILWKQLTPQLHINYSSIDKKRFRDLLGLGGWASINQIGALLLLQIDLIVVNTLYGADMTGRYGSVLIFTTLILTMTTTVVGVLSPAIMARYAVDDVEGMKRIAVRSVKLLGIGLAVPVGLLCGFGRPLLTLWLGPEFADLDILLVLLVGHLNVNLAVRPLLYVLTAFNRMKAQALLTLVIGVGNLALAIALAHWAGWGVAGVAAAAAIAWTIKNVFLLSSYSASVMNLKWWTFYAPLTAGAFGTLGIALAGRITTQFWWPSSWFDLGLMASGITMIYCLLSLALSLNRSDRELLWSLIGRRSHV
jgi:membrane protein EpsK